MTIIIIFILKIYLCLKNQIKYYYTTNSEFISKNYLFYDDYNFKSKNKANPF